MKIMPVQKQTRAGQRTRFKAFVAIGDFDGHVGLGVKCAKEVATAIRGAIILAKLSVIPVRRGYWGAKLGNPHTVPCKVNGKVGSVFVALVPAPRGTGIVAAPASKRMLQLAGVEDVYTQSRGNTSTMGNFIKATFVAISETYSFLCVLFVASDWELRADSCPFSAPPISGPPSLPPRLRSRSSLPTSVRSSRCPDLETRFANVVRVHRAPVQEAVLGEWSGAGGIWKSRTRQWSLLGAKHLAHFA